jgi:hypothetical protein
LGPDPHETFTTPVPPGFVSRVPSGPDPTLSFRAIQLPEQFGLEALTSDGAWIEFGRYAGDMFSRLEDGSYVCAGWGASPLFLRVVRQDGVVLYVLDGGGQPYAYRFVE